MCKWKADHIGISVGNVFFLNLPIETDGLNMFCKWNTWVKNNGKLVNTLKLVPIDTIHLC